MCMPTSSGRALPGSSGQTCVAQARSINKRAQLRSRARNICVRPAAAYNDKRGVQNDLSKTAVLAAGILSCLLTAHPAHAQKIWRPRRHHRRIGERYGYNWADPIVAKLEEEERLQQEAKRKAAEAARKLQEQKLARKRALKEEKRRQREAKQRTEQNIRKAKEAVLSVVTFPRRVGEFVTSYIGVANLAIFLGLLFLLLKFVLAGPLMSLWAGLSGAGWRPRGAGKWVSDRSLGGKLVWVPDVPEVPAPGAAASSSVASAATPSTARGTLKDTDFDELAKVAAVAGSSAAAKAATAASAVQELPDWWQQQEGGRSRGMSEAAMAEKQAAADKLLRGLEKGKVAGEDYSLPNLVKLHSICLEAGCAVTPSTVGGRDAMYRAAVEGAIRAASNQLRYGRELGGWTPQQLVVGLAGALGLTQDRALKIARSCVAAEMRSKLVEVVASNKRGDQPSLVVSLLQLADLQAGLPLLSASSPEVDMIASSLNTRASLDERHAILAIAATVAPSEAALFAALLGFDPPQVVPQVIQQLRAQRDDLEAAAEGEDGARGA